MAADALAGSVAAALDRLAGTTHALGIALSGGGDSIALMHLARAWRGGRRLMAATVDHRLRAGSAAEADAAGMAAAGLGIPHIVLTWHETPAGNLMAAARQARLSLLAEWARAEQLDAVLLGHTADDLAETLLMRLGRGAGIDGLAAMAEQRHAEGITWLRPMLSVGRADLRAWLDRRGIAHVEDPMNSDLRFDRARARAAIATLELDPLRLAESARHLDRAREALHELALGAARGITSVHGSLRLPRASFEAAPEELRRIILLAACRAVTGAAEPPRRDALIAALSDLAQGRQAALAGTLIVRRKDRIHITREPAAALRSPPLTSDGLWDGRFRIGGLPAGAEVRALGQGAAKQGFDGLLPVEAEALPGLWQGATLVSSLLHDPVPGMTIDALATEDSFREAILAR